MVYAQRHRLLTFNGSLWPSAPEQFTFGIRLANVAPVVQADIDGIATICQTWYASTGLQIYQGHTLNNIKLAPIDVDGRYPPGEDSVQHDYSPAIAGGGGISNIYPSQISLALTWRTALPRGRASHGRIYLPPTTHALGGSGVIASSTANPLLAPTRTFLNALAASGVGVPIVASKVASGTWQNITSFSVGLVFDTIRRRRRSLAEGYISQSLP